MLDLDLSIDPITPELAAEIDPEVRRALFMQSTGEPRSVVSVVAFKLKIPQQNLRVHTTPDTDRERMGFGRCDITKVLAREVKQYDGWGLRFRASLASPSRDQLEYVSDMLYRQMFITAEQTDPTLFESHEAGKPEKVKAPRLSRKAKQQKLQVVDDQSAAVDPDAHLVDEAVADVVGEVSADEQGERMPLPPATRTVKKKAKAKAKGKPAPAKKAKGKPAPAKKAKMLGSPKKKGEK